jgi:uncharacterized protein (TIGR03382 family)
LSAADLPQDPTAATDPADEGPGGILVGELRPDEPPDIAVPSAGCNAGPALPVATVPLLLALAAIALRRRLAH